MSEHKKSWPRRLFGLLWGMVVTLYRLFVLLVVLIVVVGLWNVLQGGAPVTVDDNMALVIWPSGALVEETEVDPTTALIQDLTGSPPSQTLLRDLIEALERAADDDRIRLAVLKLDEMQGAGLPQLEELVVAMDRFRAADKPIWVHAAYYDQMAYYLAAHADHVLLDPEGMVGLEGFSYYGTYFKEALDKLGVTVHVFRVGEYKSAVEPYTRNDMSAAAEEANLDWLGDLWTRYSASVGAARKLPADVADDYTRSLPQRMVAANGDAAAIALDSGLVTRLATLHDFRAAIAETVGFDEDHGSFRQINHRSYLRAVRGASLAEEGTEDGGVALVVVQGELVDGEGGVGQAGGDRISAMLADVRQDDDVHAVVLRVNSPGGSTWASEQIRREVQRLRAAGKPVVASMSTLAASGGYWISMDADQIWAHDTTITGSIGIFGLIPTIEEPLDRIGIHTDGVGTTPLAGAFRIDRPLAEPVKLMYQAMIERGYRQFIEGVASGRGLTVQEVERIARGRVWSGADALDLALVDHLGGLDDAARAAAELAGLAEGSWSLRTVEPVSESPLQMLGDWFGHAQLSLEFLPDSWGARLIGWLQAQARFGHLPVLNDPRGVYAHCMCVPVTGSARPTLD